MTLEMHYQEKYEEGLERGREQGAIKTAQRMLEEGELSMEKIAGYSGLTLEQVKELSEELQTV